MIARPTISAVEIIAKAINHQKESTMAAKKNSTDTSIADESKTDDDEVKMSLTVKDHAVGHVLRAIDPIRGVEQIAFDDMKTVLIAGEADDYE
jgi:hypothetical protein